MTDFEIDGNWTILILVMRKHSGRLFIQLCLRQVFWGVHSTMMHCIYSIMFQQPACQRTFSHLTTQNEWQCPSQHTLYFRLVDDGFVAIYYLKCCCDFHISPKLKRGSLLIPAVQFKKLYKSENMQFMHLFCEHTNAKGWSWPCAWPQVKLSPTSHLTPELSTDLLGSKVC